MLTKPCTTSTPTACSGRRGKRGVDCAGTSALRVKTAAQIRSQAKLLKARCDAALGQHVQARTQLEKLLKNKDLDDAAQYRLARLALHCGDLTKAQTLLQAYLRKHPQVTAPKQALLLCHIYAGEAEKC